MPKKKKPLPYSGLPYPEAVDGEYTDIGAPYPDVGFAPNPRPVDNSPLDLNPGSRTPPASLLNPVGSFQKPVYPSQNATDYGAGSNFDPSRLPIGVGMNPGESPYSNPKYADDIKTQAVVKSGQAAMGYLMPFQAGLGAGSQVSATPDASDAALQVGGATMAGAASGALTGAAIGAAGGPIGAIGGAAIGGLTALVSGGLQAYLGVKASREANRKNERIQAAIQARQDARDAQMRADTQEQTRYNRKIAALQSQWNAMQTANGYLNDLITKDQSIKQHLQLTGR